MRSQRRRRNMRWVGVWCGVCSDFAAVGDVWCERACHLISLKHLHANFTPPANGVQVTRSLPDTATKGFP